MLSPPNLPLETVGIASKQAFRERKFNGQYTLLFGQSQMKNDHCLRNMVKSLFVALNW